jgi:hypothetical protein
MVKIIPKNKSSNKENKSRQLEKNKIIKNVSKKELRKMNSFYHNKPRIKNRIKIKRKNMFKTISPFYINSEISFFMTLKIWKILKILVQI